MCIRDSLQTRVQEVLARDPPSGPEHVVAVAAPTPISSSSVCCWGHPLSWWAAVAGTSSAGPRLDVQTVVQKHSTPKSC
eukprot:7247279-Pyramimonas_sp.AAC.1